MHACIINIQGPHQRALVKRTSLIMKNEQDVIIQMESGTRCPDRANTPSPCRGHGMKLYY